MSDVEQLNPQSLTGLLFRLTSLVSRNDGLCKIAAKQKNTRLWIRLSPRLEFILIEMKLRTKMFFCDPYHSWQRGTNENTNGLHFSGILAGSDHHRLLILNTITA